MLDPIITTIVAVIAAPAVMATIQYFFQRGLKKQDWARQDLVAERLAQTNRTLTATAIDTHDSLTAIQSGQAALKNGQKQIHALVNSNLTAAMQSQYDALVRELTGLHELVSVKRKFKVKPSAKTLTAIKQAEKNLAELKAQLEQRHAETLKGEQEASTGRTNGNWVNGGNINPNGGEQNQNWIAGGSNK